MNYNLDTYNPNSNLVSTRQQNTPDIDAFGRTRVSQVTTQADFKQLHDNLPLFIDTELNGSASSTHTATNAETEIATNNSGDWVVAQTKQRFNYQSGKSQEIFMTLHSFGLEANVVKRIGYFSSSVASPFDADLDGFWFESNGTTFDFVSSKTGTETSRVSRADWYDPMDGTGESGLDFGTLDGNIINQFDFEWLGLGRIRFVFVSGGNRYLVHSVDFVNGSKRQTTEGWVMIDANFKGVYMSSPNQPLRWEVRQTGVGSGSMCYICSTVGSEGSINKVGKVLSVDNGTTHINATNNSRIYLIHAIRLNSAKLDTVIDILDLTFLATTNDDYLWSVRLNPTISSGTVTYSALTDSSLDHALGNGQYLTGGTVLKAGYIEGNRGGITSVDNAIKIGAKIDGTPDELMICVQPITNGLDILGSLNFKELT